MKSKTLRRFRNCRRRPSRDGWLKKDTTRGILFFRDGNTNLEFPHSQCDGASLNEFGRIVCFQGLSN